VGSHSFGTEQPGWRNERVPALAARGSVATGREKSDQKHRGTDVEKVSDNIRLRTCWRKGTNAPIIVQQDGERSCTDGLFNQIFTDDGSLCVTPQTIAAGKLHDMVGIALTRRVCHEGQRPRHTVVFMTDTDDFMMKHESNPICSWLQIGAVIHIQRPKHCDHARAERRKRNDVQQQPAPSGKKP
jgi:hypothetical protein